ncbi:hypothetical protein, partial [Bacillus pumilus]|uniref:hypothetical protein n=1 Tax=Bacillus pumilus TaxID=1408 RepID=UPI001C92FA12
KTSYENVSFQPLEKRLPQLKHIHQYKQINKLFKNTKPILHQAGQQINLYQQQPSLFKQNIKKPHSLIQSFSTNQKQL